MNYEIKCYELLDLVVFDDSSKRLELIMTQLYEMLKLNLNAYPFKFYSKGKPWLYFMDPDIQILIKDENDLQYKARFYSIVYTANRHTEDYIGLDIHYLDRAFCRFNEKKNQYPLFNDYMNNEPNPYFDDIDLVKEKYPQIKPKFGFENYGSFDEFMKLHAFADPNDYEEIEFNNLLGDYYKQNTNDLNDNLKHVVDTYHRFFISYKIHKQGVNLDKLSFEEFLVSNNQL